MLIQKFVQIAQQSQLDNIHFISDHSQGTGGNLWENRINKGKSMAKFLYSCVTGPTIQTVYKCGPL